MMSNFETIAMAVVKGIRQMLCHLEENFCGPQIRMGMSKSASFQISKVCWKIFDGDDFELSSCHIRAGADTVESSARLL